MNPATSMAPNSKPHLKGHRRKYGDDVRTYQGPAHVESACGMMGRLPRGLIQV